MKRSISASALLLSSVSATLGSGWLFSSYYTAQLAGPAALVSWIIGGCIIICIAFVFAELCTLIPITGSSARIPRCTHGVLVNFIFSWMIWLSYVALVPTEVQAVVQYISYFFSGFIRMDGGLTRMGYMLATVLMLMISGFNVLSVRWLLKCNSILTLLKIIIPLIVVFCICSQYFSWSTTFHAGSGSFAPSGIQGIFAAITTGGIVFAFNGFKQACELAGETHRPSRALPFAIIGSVVLCLIIYILLQIAFFVSLTTENFTGDGHHLILSNAHSPMAAVVHQDHLDGLLPVLYCGAIIGPLAAGLIYASGASRSLYGMSCSRHVPKILSTLNRHGNPIHAVLINFFVGMCLFVPLPGWNHMTNFLTSLMAITYAVAPVCLLALRMQLKNYVRPFWLPCAHLWSFVAFYLCTLLAYWSGWDILSKLGITIFTGCIVLIVEHVRTPVQERESMSWRASLWIWPYFLGLLTLSYLGSFGHGCGLVSLGWDFFYLALLCGISLYLAVRFKLSAQETEYHITNCLNRN